MAGPEGLAVVFVANEQPSVLVEDDDSMSDPIDCFSEPAEQEPLLLGQGFLLPDCREFEGDVGADPAIPGKGAVRIEDRKPARLDEALLPVMANLAEDEIPEGTMRAHVPLERASARRIVCHVDDARP